MPRRRTNNATEFDYAGEPWKVEQWAKLKAVFGLGNVRILPHFVNFCQQQQAERFKLLRMLYGINPGQPRNDGDHDPDVQRVWEPEEIMALPNHGPEKFVTDFNELKAAWESYDRKQRLPEAVAIPPEKTLVQKAQEQAGQEVAPVSLADLYPPKWESVCHAFEFDPTMFNLPHREEPARLAEVKWFINRLQELEKIFSEPMAKSLGRQALHNELLMRRCDDKMMRIDPATKSFWEIQDTKLKLEGIYSSQWAQIEEVCPDIKVSASKSVLNAVLSDVIDAVREFKANGNNDLIDGVFTQLEIEVDMRQAEQHEARYRPGFVAFINEARRGMWNPRWKCQTKQEVFHIMDACWKATAAEMVEKLGIKLPDLEKDGATGEYPPLTEPDASLPPDDARDSNNPADTRTEHSEAA